MEVADGAIDVEVLVDVAQGAAQERWCATSRWDLGTELPAWEPGPTLPGVFRV